MIRLTCLMNSRLKLSATVFEIKGCGLEELFRCVNSSGPQVLIEAHYEFGFTGFLGWSSRSPWSTLARNPE